MDRTKLIANLVAVFGGFLVLGAAIPLLWKHMCSPTDLWILVGMYLPTALGITVGYHRLFAHRAFATYPFIRYLLAGLGSMAGQGPVIEWVSDHRRHHAFSDHEGDPHSPHVGRPKGIWGNLAGFWHSHVGWLFSAQGLADREIYAKDLRQDRGLVFVDRAFPAFVILTFVLPFLIGFAVSHSIFGGWTALFWGGLFRLILMHHVTFSVNSLCHMFGTRRFAVDDKSRNLSCLSVLTLGESWHHNHHAFPRSASHGLLWWELDLSGLFIRALRSLNLAWDVVEISPERQRMKEVADATHRA